MGDRRQLSGKLDRELSGELTGGLSERRIFRERGCQGSWMRMEWRGIWSVGVVRDIGSQ